MQLIELLGEVSDVTSLGLSNTASQEDREDHINFLRILEWRIQNTIVTSEAQQLGSECRKVMELFKLATLVYLNRTTEDILGHNIKTQMLVERGFEMLASLPFCDRQFPIFILGCEARSDEQRAVILDVMSRVEARMLSRAYIYTRMILQGLWSQDDLADGPMPYWHKISQVMRRCTNLPTFV